MNSTFAKIVVALVLAVSFRTMAQQKVPLLERTVTISLVNERIDDALAKIGDAGRFSFSYKSSLLDKNRRVTYEFVNKSVREILDQLFQGSVDYRERGRHIILVKAEKTAAKESSTVSGYIIDEATGKRLQNVSVYDPLTLNSAVTDAYGFFKIEVKNPTGEEIRLAVNKKQYTDTLVVVPTNNRRLLNIPIKIDREKLVVIADSVGSKLKRFWIATMTATEQAVNMENISDTIHREYQLGVAPFVGTNGNLSGNVINDFSLNMLGGYSLGNRKAEFSGLFSATRGDVTGFQGAGLANGVAGELHGVQVAGLANGVLSRSRGVQVAGLTNLNDGPSSGVRAAGLLNFLNDGSDAVLISGGGNLVDGTQRQPQLGGLFNLTTSDVRPAQIAGLFNFSGGTVEGVQLSGLMNFADEDVSGAQVSGLLNVAPRNIRGAQVGFINYGKWVRGTQVGFINVSSQVKGLPIGFLSVVGKGYHKLEIAADEIFYTNLSFRTGVRQFYNIITVGAKPSSFEQEKTIWAFGYGVGTAPKLAKWLHLNFDLTSSQIVDGNEIPSINLLNRLYGGFDFQLTKGFSITAGITFNGQVTDPSYSSYPEIFSDYIPKIVAEDRISSDINVRYWWGAKAGLRFF